jgi:DNA-binding response OmpR family regulator
MSIARKNGKGYNELCLKIRSPRIGTATMVDVKRNGLLYVACRRGRPEKLIPSTELREYVARCLQQDGSAQLEWKVVSNQKHALAALRPEPPRLALVEIDVDNQRLEFCAALRERAPSLKIVAVGVLPPTATAAIDAVLCSPVDIDQIASVFTRLLDAYRAGVLQVGFLSLDVDTRTLVTPKGQYHMTPKATTLLHYLMTHHDQVLSRSALMENVWDTTFLGDTRTLDVHIRWLRERIEADPSDPKFLITVRGRGYRLRL